MNIEGITLHLLLQQDREQALKYYSEINNDYFSSSFSSVLKHINSFYQDKGYIPNIGELEVYRSRDRKVLSALASLRLIDPGPIDIEVAIEELANQYAQNTILDLIDAMLETISMTDRHSLLDEVSGLTHKLEEKITSTNCVQTIADIKVFKRPDVLFNQKVYSGVCDEWDQEAGGYYKQELVLIGGKAGSGKSIFCANLVAQQHLQKNVSIYFTIEMTAGETMQRIICILADVSTADLKQGNLCDDDSRKVAAVMASLFEGGNKVFDKYFNSGKNVDIFDFQDELYDTCEEKEEGKIIIVDDRSLSVGGVDAKLSTYKSKYGDKLGLGVVDYLNQLVLDSTTDMYDWKPQIVVSKTLKNLARKYDMCIVSPYQMNEDGIARFSKGILDAADVAQLLKVDSKDSNSLLLETTKARGTNDEGRHRVGISWTSLRIDPRAVVLEDMEPVEDDNSKLGKAVEGLGI